MAKILFLLFILASPYFVGDPHKMHYRPHSFPPDPPSIETNHYLGTDEMGRDVLALLVHGLRNACLFSLLLLAFNYIIGGFLGAVMGYYGGIIDLLLLQWMEILSTLQLFYLVIFLSMVLKPSFFLLALLFSLHGHLAVARHVRGFILQEKQALYVIALRSMGCSSFRLLWRHILPNIFPKLEALMPFSFVGGFTLLTAVEFLGFGPPPPMVGLGELFRQGVSSFEAYWITLPVVMTMVIILVKITKKRDFT